MDAILDFKKMDEISQERKDNILYHNPKALYGLQEPVRVIES